MQKYPKLKDRVQSEAEITKHIREYLNMRGIYHWKQFQSLGSKRGISDIIGIYKGRFLAIEVKTQSGKLTEHQQTFLDHIQLDGGISIVARSVQDVRDVLEWKQ